MRVSKHIMLTAGTSYLSFKLLPAVHLHAYQHMLLSDSSCLTSAVQHAPADVFQLNCLGWLHYMQALHVGALTCQRQQTHLHPPHLH